MRPTRTAGSPTGSRRPLAVAARSGRPPRQAPPQRPRPPRPRSRDPAPATSDRRGPAGAARRLQAPRRDLRGEPLLRQPLRHLGRGRRPARRRASPTRRGASSTQVAQDGTPYACLPQNDVNLTSPPLSNTCQDAAPRHRREPLRATAVHHRRLHQAEDRTCPAPGVSAPNGVLEGLPGRRAGRLHPRPRAPLLPGAVPDRRRQAGPLHHRLRRGRPDPGRATTPSSCRSTATCTARARPKYVDRRPLLPGRLRRLVPQPPVADRRAGAARHRADGAPTRRRPPTRCSTPTGCRRATRSTRRPGRSSTAS